MTHTNERTQSCPKCHFEEAERATSCRRCGIVFAKFDPYRRRPSAGPTPAEASYGSHERSAQTNAYRPSNGISVLPIVLLVLVAGVAAYWYLDKPYEVVGAEPADGGPIVIFMHGYGAPGDDLVRAASSIATEAPEASFVVLEAPHFMGLGRAWVKGGSRAETISQANESRQRVLAAYDGLVEEGVSPDDIYLGGFSQGAQMSLDVAFGAGSERRFGGLILLSGGFPNWPESAASGSLNESNLSSSARAVVVHGRDDRVIHFDAGNQVMREVSPYAETEWVPFDGGHTIAPEAELAIARFLQEH